METAGKLLEPPEAGKLESAASSAAARAARRRWVALALAVGAAAGWGVPLAPKRFATVEPGRLYRSGGPTTRELVEVTRAHGIRTVLCLLNPDAPEVQAERDAVLRLGLRWINIPLPGNGASTPAEREAILNVLLDETSGPTLVHCAAGTNRTGLAVGLYRLVQQGWTLDDVLKELDRFGFDDLPKHENLRAALRQTAAQRVAGRQATATPAAAEGGP